MGFLDILLQTPDIFWKMVLGGFIIGLPVAIISYYFSYKVLYKYQADIRRKILESKKKRARKKEIRKRRRIKKKRQSSEQTTNL
jgi:H+/gluconate symporter-like permease